MYASACSLSSSAVETWGGTDPPAMPTLPLAESAGEDEDGADGTWSGRLPAPALKTTEKTASKFYSDHNKFRSDPHTKPTHKDNKR